MKIFFDLDGTLIDARLRLYQLFQHLVPQSSMSFDDYWDLKREQVDHKQILSEKFQFQRGEILTFENQWMNSIEEEDWLKYDQPFENITNLLQDLKDNNVSIYIITARQKRDRAIAQIEEFGWLSLIDVVLVTEHKHQKVDLIKPYLDQNGINWMVGDTGKDIQAGKQLKMKTAAVDSGFLNIERLKMYKPDQVAKYVTDLKFN